MDSAGVKKAGTSIDYCNNWTDGSTTYTTRVGRANLTAGGWADDNFSGCHITTKLYCIEQ